MYVYRKVYIYTFLLYCLEKLIFNVSFNKWIMIMKKNMKKKLIMTLPMSSIFVDFLLL